MTDFESSRAAAAEQMQREAIDRKLDALQQKCEALKDAPPLLDSSERSRRLRGLAQLREALRVCLGENKEVWRPTRLYLSLDETSVALADEQGSARVGFNELKAGLDAELKNAAKLGNRFHTSAEAVGTTTDIASCSHAAVFITPEFFTNPAEFNSVIEKMEALQAAKKPIMMVWFGPQAELAKFNDKPGKEGYFSQLAKTQGSDAVLKLRKLNACRITTDGTTSFSQEGKTIIQEFIRRGRVLNDDDDFTFDEVKAAKAGATTTETLSPTEGLTALKELTAEMKGSWKQLADEIIQLAADIRSIPDQAVVKKFLGKVARLREELRNRLKENGLDFFFVSYRSTKAGPMLELCALLSEQLGMQMAIDQQRLTRAEPKPGAAATVSPAVLALARLNVSIDGGVANWSERLGTQIERSTKGLVAIDESFFTTPKEVAKEISQLDRLGKPLTIIFTDSAEVRGSLPARFAEFKTKAKAMLAGLEDYGGEPVNVERVLELLAPYFSEPPEKQALFLEPNATNTGFNEESRGRAVHYFKTGEIKAPGELTRKKEVPKLRAAFPTRRSGNEGTPGSHGGNSEKK